MKTLLVVVIFIVLIIPPTINLAQSQIEDQLKNARESNKMREQKLLESGLCTGADCPEDKNMHELIRKYGYDENRHGAIISTNDVIEFLDDYNSGNLVNKTTINNNTEGNFCFNPDNCVIVTEKAKEARALFDRYWK